MLWSIVAIVIAVLAAFSPALTAGFVQWDDPSFVLDNPHVRGFSAENLRWMLTNSHTGHYHPLTFMSWALDYTLMGGYHAWGFHLTNVALHAIVCVLLLLVLRRLVGAALGIEHQSRRVTLASAAGALLFAVHPLRVESVAWITERRDVLSAAWLLAALLAYLASVTPGSAHARRWHWLAVALLVLSCLSKAWGMSFFVVLVLLDWRPLRRLPASPAAWLRPEARGVLLEKVPFAFVGVCTAAAAAWAQYQTMATQALHTWGPIERCVQAAYGLFFYAMRTVYPTDLSPLYELPARLSPFEARYLLAYAFIVAVLALLWAFRRRWPTLASCAAIYFVLLAPVLGILQSGVQFVADRYSYLSCMVISGVLAGGLVTLSKARGAGSAVPVAVLVVGASATLGLLTFSQATHWNNSLSLWTHAASITPTSGVLTNLAIELERLGRNDDAFNANLAAVHANPGDGRAWFSLASRLKDLGRIGEAEEAYRRAAETMPQAYMAHVNLGLVYLKDPARQSAAIEQFRMAVADVQRGGRRPLSPGPYLVLGMALRQKGDITEARAHLLRALEFDETRAQAAAELKLLDSVPTPPTTP